MLNVNPVDLLIRGRLQPTPLPPMQVFHFLVLHEDPGCLEQQTPVLLSLCFPALQHACRRGGLQVL